MAGPDLVEVEPRLEFGERRQIADERERVQQKDGIATEQGGDNASKSRAQHQVYGPRGRRQSVRHDHVFALHNVWDDGIARGFKKGDQQGLSHEKRIHEPNSFF